MAAERVAGLIQIAYNGIKVKAVGSFDIQLGRPKRDPKVGVDEVHGFTEMPQAPKLTGEITIDSATDIDGILLMNNATITIEAVGKTFLFSEAYFCGEGAYATEEGNLNFEISALSADYI